MNNNVQIGSIVLVEDFETEYYWYGVIITEPLSIVRHGSLTFKKIVNMAIFDTLKEAKTIQKINEHDKFYNCSLDGIEDTGYFNDYVLFCNL